MPRKREPQSWTHRLRPGRPLLEAWILSAVIVSISNVLAQFLDSRKAKEPFTFDLARWLRFLILDLITAPVNYKWQELLDTTFPRHHNGSSSKGKYSSIPLQDRDVEKDSTAGDDDEDEQHERSRTPNEQEEESSEQPPESSTTRPRSNSKLTPKPTYKPPHLRKNWPNIFTKWFIDCITLGAIFNTLAFLIIMGLLNGTPSKIWFNVRTRTMTIIVNGYKIWPFANIVAQAFIPFERRIIFFAVVALFWNIYLSVVAAVL